MLLWQTMRFTNNVLVRGKKRTRCSNSLVQAQKTLWLKKIVVIKGGKLSRGDSEPHTEEAILSALQDFLLGLVVFDLAPFGGFHLCQLSQSSVFQQLQSALFAKALMN